MENKDFCLLFLIVLTLFFFGCPMDEPKDPVLEHDYEFIDDLNYSRVITEYPKYLLKRGEARKIWIGGYTKDRPVTVTHLWLNFDGEKSEAVKLEKPINFEYFQPMFLIHNKEWSSSKNFKAEIGPLNTDGCYAYASAIIEIINSRDYFIEYNCQGSNYDLYNLGYDFENTVKGAFSKVSTRVDRIVKHNINIPPEIIDVSTQAPMIEYGDDFVSRGEYHDPKIGVIFGVKDHNGNVEDRAIGKSARSPTSPRRSYGFVFIDRINSNFPDHPENYKKVLRTRTAIHELAHVRRKECGGAFLGDIDHAFHQGVGKDSCIFKGAVWKPENAFEFCEWHEQIFLNINWN